MTQQIRSPVWCLLLGDGLQFLIVWDICEHVMYSTWRGGCSIVISACFSVYLPIQHLKLRIESMGGCWICAVWCYLLNHMALLQQFIVSHITCWIIHCWRESSPLTYRHLVVLLSWEHLLKTLIQWVSFGTQVTSGMISPICEGVWIFTCEAWSKSIQTDAVKLTILNLP